jgi:hypothetical protein
MKHSALIAALVLCLSFSASVADEAPTITITEPAHGSWNFTATGNQPVAIAQAPGVALEFSWTATPGSGTVIVDYRYGWDLLDPDDPDDPGWSSWGSDLSAPPRAFAAGAHTFTAQARNDLGGVGRGTFQITIEDPLSTEPSSWGAIKALYR